MGGDFNIDVTKKKITFLLDSGASDDLINREELTGSFPNYSLQWKFL